MIRLIKSLTLAFVLTMTLFVQTAYAASQDYSFEVAHQPIKVGHEATFTLHITKPGIVITQSKLHMVMGTMDMPAPVKIVSTDATGDTRFSADLTMYGEWTLDLVATAPNEKEPIHTTVKFQVVK